MRQWVKGTEIFTDCTRLYFIPGLFHNYGTTRHCEFRALFFTPGGMKQSPGYFNLRFHRALAATVQAICLNFVPWQHGELRSIYSSYFSIYFCARITSSINIYSFGKWDEILCEEFLQKVATSNVFYVNITNYKISLPTHGEFKDIIKHIPLLLIKTYY